MKVKTITCHNVYNFGASLQAHALLSYISSIGHDVDVIDYMPSYITHNLSLWAIGSKWNKNVFLRFAFYCYVVPQRLMQLKSRKKFDQFTNKYLKLTKRYNSFEELQADPPIADVYFCGSDQIWNPQIYNGLDPAFYIAFAPNGSTRASYAASFSVSSITEAEQKIMQPLLQKLDYIAVREKTGLSLLKDMGIEGGVNVVDPVFLMTRNYWSSLTYTPKYKNYILVYDQENSKEIKQCAKYLSKKTGKQIVAFRDLYPRHYADHVEAYAGPLDFISLISNADLVITNSFHCLSFSLILNTEFFVVPRTHQKVNSRMEDLMSIMGVSDRFIKNIEQIDRATDIDCTYVKSAIDEMRSSSFNYIDMILRSKK